MIKFTKAKLTLCISCLLLSGINPAVTLAVSCGDYLTSDVVFSSDLHCTSGYTAFEVAADNITIDLNGFTLSGPDTLSGFNVNEYDKISIKNGSIKGFWVGINSSRADQLMVDNVVFYETGDGVIVSSGNHARITNNDFINLRNRGVSVYVWNKHESANENSITDNEFYQVREGIVLCGNQSDYNTIADNLIWKARDHAINLNQSDRNNVYRNRILQTGDGAAIRVNNSSYNLIEKNALQEGSTTAVAIYANAGSGCLNTGRRHSDKNILRENRVMAFPSAIVLGLGASSVGDVEGNGLLNNQLNDNDLGILFQTDSVRNYARGNNFAGTATPVQDYGVNSNY